ncbi:MAG TPA: DUF4404 family protein [Verrucomicrobiae bacterium]|nr:DUF4404 family protein [Verrucomicrobiae bacterium]
MIQETIGEIEAKIRGANSIDAKSKTELLQLLAKLKTEIAAGENQNLDSLKGPVEDLRASVEGFEQSHPKLVQAVNNISNLLANLGI